MYRNPYSQAMQYQAQADEERKRLEALGVTPEQMASARQTGDMRRRFAPDYEAQAARQAALAPAESALERQRATAAAMRGREMPGGRTVGPSNIYVENPYEQVAAGIERLAGGYFDRKASEYEQDTVQPLRRAAAAGEADIQSRDTAFKLYQAQQEEERAAREEARAERGLDLDERGLEADIAENAAARELERRGLAVDEAEVEVQYGTGPDGAPVAYVMEYDSDRRRAIPTNPVTGEPVELVGTEDELAGGGGSASFNQPERYIDPYTGEEVYAAWNKGRGQYYDSLNQRWLKPEDMRGFTREKEMSEGQVQNALGKFIERNKDTLALLKDIEAAESTWRDYGMEPGENPFNWFTKQAGALGDVARLVDDVGEDGTPTQDSYAAMQTVFNTISRLRAGLSQTVAEIQRIKEETGQNPLVSPDVMMRYWDRLKDKVDNDIAIANRAMSPRMLQAYNRWDRNKDSDVATSSGGTTARAGGGQSARTRRQVQEGGPDEDEEFDMLFNSVD